MLAAGDKHSSVWNLYWKIKTLNLYAWKLLDFFSNFISYSQKV